MHIVRFRSDDSGTARIGLLESELVFDVGPEADLLQMLHMLTTEGPDSMAKGSAHELAKVKLLSPISKPPKVIAIGLNYESHRLETRAEQPTEPTVFSKFATAIIGPEEAIVLPAVAPRRVDYEAELAVVLGRGGRNIPEGVAMSTVAGYVAANDISARDWQIRKPNGQWLLGKTFDTFLPIGPAIVTADEVREPHALQISCVVSGEVLQSASTSEMIFQIPTLISYLSRVFTLEVGDLILTGTPAGVGMARTPPRWLEDGDIVETTIEGIGTLRNIVRSEGHSADSVERS
jgi:2-keto-4-pentenoate hydratase/2-oxohepta-3-ene-1,7-dioic acid hydratase in catechol pathway